MGLRVGEKLLVPVVFGICWLWLSTGPVHSQLRKISLPSSHTLFCTTPAQQIKRTKGYFLNHHPIPSSALLGGSLVSKFWLGMLILATDRYNKNFDAIDYMQIF